MPTEVARIAALRRKAARLGLRITKSRARHWHSNNKLGWMVLDDRNVVVDGPDYELTLENVERVLAAAEERSRAV